MHTHSQQPPAAADALPRRGRVGGAPRALPAGWRLRRACGLAFLAGTTTGCYSYVPLQPAAVGPGARVVLEVNDRGRVALTDSLGPSVDRIEGEVQSRSDSSYLLSVVFVDYVNGSRHAWAGEPLSVPADAVGGLRERRISRGRTALAIVGGIGAVLAFALTRDLLGHGSVGKEPPDPGPGPDQ